MNTIRLAALLMVISIILSCSQNLKTPVVEEIKDL